MLQRGKVLKFKPQFDSNYFFPSFGQISHNSERNQTLLSQIAIFLLHKISMSITILIELMATVRGLRGLMRRQIGEKIRIKVKYYT